MKINAFIACRLGSKRIKFKNLLLLEGKPLFSYLTNNAILCKRISNLYINTDSELIIKVAKDIYKKRLNYFLREPHLGTSSTSLDDYVFDFMKKCPGDITIFLNPCSVFLRAQTIDNAIEYFINRKLDSCCASEVSQTHCFYKNKSINFDINKKQPRSQDLTPVHCMTSGFFIWRNNIFLKNYRNNSAANFSGNFESYGISKFESIDIDTYEDLNFAKKILSQNNQKNSYEYHDSIKDLVKNNLIQPN